MYKIYIVSPNYFSTISNSLNIGNVLFCLYYFQLRYADQYVCHLDNIRSSLTYTREGKYSVRCTAISRTVNRCVKSLLREKLGKVKYFKPYYFTALQTFVLIANHKSLEKVTKVFIADLIKELLIG